MNVLITGGAGFIGRQVVPLLLEQGDEVTVIDALTQTVHGPDAQPAAVIRENCHFVRGDIRDPAVWGVLDESAPQVIVHLAAETGVGQSMYEVARYTDVNIQGTSVMLDAIRSHGAPVEHVVLASSRAVYGEGSYKCESCGVVTPHPRVAERLAAGLWDPTCPICDGDVEGVATREDAPRRPSSVYAMTKAVQEDLLRTIAPTLGATTAVLRYANVYGEGQPLTNPYTGVLSAFGLRLVKGQAPRLYEDGLPTRDFVHVEDVATATALAVGVQGNLTANIGSGERWTLQDIAREQTEEFGLDPGDIEVTGQYRLGDIRGFAADIATANDLVDYRPRVRLNQGLGRLNAWIRVDAAIPEEDVAATAESELKSRGLLGAAKDSF